MTVTGRTRHTAEQHFRYLIQHHRQHIEREYGGSHQPESLGIVGAGVMGAWIAAAALQHSVPVVLTDHDQNALATAPKRIAHWLNGHGAGSWPSDQASALDRLRLTDEVGIVGQCDLVLEAIKEDALVKQPQLARLERVLGNGSVLSSNTSTLPIDHLGGGLVDSGRFCGCHFFLPLGQPPILEIVRGTRSRSATIGTVAAFAQKISHIPFVVGDAPGFVLNRLMLPYLGEALQLLLEGVSVDEIEMAATNFGMNIGPLRLCDEIGLDTVLYCGAAMLGSAKDLVVRTPLVVAMVKRGLLGRKSGAGFYRYGPPDGATPSGSAVTKTTRPTHNPDRSAREEPGRMCVVKETLLVAAPPPPGCPDPQIENLIDPWRETVRQHTEQTIITRLLLPVLLEASRMMQQERVRGPEEIDLAAAMFGFPLTRGGLLYWADTLGPKEVVDMARSLDYLGKRSWPTPLMLEMAASGSRYFQIQADDL